MGRADLLRAIAAGVDPDGAATACGFKRREPDDKPTDEAQAALDRALALDDGIRITMARQNLAAAGKEPVREDTR